MLVRRKNVFNPVTREWGRELETGTWADLSLYHRPYREEGLLTQVDDGQCITVREYKTRQFLNRVAVILCTGCFLATVMWVL